MPTSTSVQLQRIARLLPKNKDLWRLGQELRRWKMETGLSDARLVSLLVQKFPEVDVPSPQRIQMLRATSSLFPKSQRLALSHSHHVFAGQHARAMVPPGTKKTEIREIATKYLRAARRNKWSVAQMRRAMATDAARGGNILHMSGPSGPSGGHYRKRTKRYEIIQGNAEEVLKTLKTPVHCVVTSVPFFGLRTYGSSKKEIGRGSARPDASVHDRPIPDALPGYLNQVCDALDAVPLDPLGSLWVNLGDSRGKDGGTLCVPERFAIEMVNRGWILSEKVVWAKAAALEDGTTVGGPFLPQPPRGRATNDAGWDYLFRFIKNKDAWLDPLAVRIPRLEGESEPYDPAMQTVTALDGRMPPNVWICSTWNSTSNAHYAVYPESLCERPIAATCPAEVCTRCGTPRTRVIEWVSYDDRREEYRRLGKYASMPTLGEDPFRRDDGKVYEPRKPVHKGWQNCACRSPVYSPGVVLDPFCGSGTTGAVALRLGRKFVGVDLYKKFCTMTVDRLAKQRTRGAARTA